ncbi:MAG TPA: radical SAM protein [Polyangium sp.]|nr:radical SAM protein [Polyangium sp.]
MRLWHRLAFAPWHVQLVVTRRCNLSCTYCNEFDEVSDPVPVTELKARLDKLAELGVFAIEFTGGEPLMHPDLCELIAYAKRLGFVRRSMITNAYKLNAERVRALNDAGLTHMQISLDGVEPNDVTVKVLRPLKPKLEVIKAHRRFSVTLSAVIGAAPAAEVLEVVQYARDNGFKPRVLLLHSQDGQIRITPEEMKVYADLQRKLGWRWREAHDYRSHLAQGRPAPFKCRAGSRYLYVDEFGIVRWCASTREIFGKPLSSYRYEDLVEQFYVEKPCNDRCTLGCVRSDSAVDEWRAQPDRWNKPRDGRTHLPIAPASAVSENRS